jgi:hypothetical protein
MTVAELIKKLEKMPQDSQVLLSTDGGWSQATKVYETVSAVCIGDEVQRGNDK